MSDLADWFTTEIRTLGFAGLEGVYDYVATMSDDQVIEYLKSLLGSEERIVDFANSYLQRRSHGNQQKRVQESQTASSEAQGWGQTARAKSKSKRGKGKDRSDGKGSSRNQHDSKSFANAVSRASTALPNTRQAQAIRDAPVERMRQQVREYRKLKRPINCIYCGKIECPVQEDGACSFCGSPIFSVWNPSEQRPRAQGLSETSHGEFTTNVPRRSLAEKPCEVLGRYVQRPRRYEDVYLQPELFDLAGRKVRNGTSVDMELTDTTDQTLPEKISKSSSSKPSKEERPSKRNTEERIQRLETGSSSNDNLFAVQGRLLVDELKPSPPLGRT